MRRKIFIIAALIAALGVGIQAFLVFYPEDVQSLRTVNHTYKLLIDPDTRDTNYILHKPLEVKIGPEGHLYVLDQGNARIMVYDKSMKFVRQIGRKGQGPGELIEPTDFDFDREGNLYVADPWGSRISIFKKDHSFLSSFRLDEWVPQDFHLAVSSEGLIYINTFEDSLITVFRPDGEKIKSFGEVFKHPTVRSAIHYWNTVALDFDPEDNLWVAFHTKPLIRKYTKEGLLLFEKELVGPEIDERKKREKPMPPETYVYYSTDIECTPKGNVLVAGHNYVYEVNASGSTIRIHVVTYPKIHDQSRFFFVNRFTYDEKDAVFYATSRFDEFLFRF